MNFLAKMLYTTTGLLAVGTLALITACSSPSPTSTPTVRPTSTPTSEIKLQRPSFQPSPTPTARSSVQFPTSHNVDLRKMLLDYVDLVSIIKRIDFSKFTYEGECNEVGPFIARDQLQLEFPGGVGCTNRYEAFIRYPVDWHLESSVAIFKSDKDAEKWLSELRRALLPPRLRQSKLLDVSRIGDDSFGIFYSYTDDYYRLGGYVFFRTDNIVGQIENTSSGENPNYVFVNENDVISQAMQLYFKIRQELRNQTGYTEVPWATKSQLK